MLSTRRFADMAKISLAIALGAFALTSCMSNSNNDNDVPVNGDFDEEGRTSVYKRAIERTLVPQSFIDAHDDVVEDFLPRTESCPVKLSRISKGRSSTNGGHLYVVRIGLDLVDRTAYTRPIHALRSCAIDSFSYVFNSYDDANVVFVRSVPQVWKLREHRLSERQVFSVHTDGKSGYSTDWRLLNGDSIEDAPVEEFVDQDFEVIAGLYADFFGGIMDAVEEGNSASIALNNWIEPLDRLFKRNDIDEDASLWMSFWLDDQVRTLSKTGLSMSVGEFKLPVSTTKLIADYESNEIRADMQYGGRQLWISGQIDSISRSVIGGGAYVVLNSGNTYDFRSVQCFFDEASLVQLQSYSKGDRVFIRGTVTGLMMNVTVDAVDIRRN